VETSRSASDHLQTDGRRTRGRLLVGSASKSSRCGSAPTSFSARTASASSPTTASTRSPGGSDAGGILPSAM